MPARRSRVAALACACLATLSVGATHYPVAPWTPPALNLWTDENRSMETGADDLIALSYATGRLEDAVLAPRWWREQRFWARFGGAGYRFGRLLFLDLPQQYFVSVLQHEYFGHGYRAREEGLRNVSYHIGIPPPYGSGGGMTTYHAPTGTLITWDVALLRSAAGEEAEGVQADRLRALWVQGGMQDSHGALLYLLLRRSLSHYLSVSHEDSLRTGRPVSNDMLSYLNDLNWKEAGVDVDGWKLRIHDLKSQERWSLVDPFWWYSLGGLAFMHLWRGETAWRYPSIPLGPARYLPAVGYGLGPWGPEYRIENLFGWGGRALNVAYRFGDATFRRSWGWDATSLGLLRAGSFIADGEVHFWRQPKLFLEIGPGPVPRREGYGAAFDLLSPALPGSIPLRLSGGAGWKTKGWVRGKDLDEGAYWRVGLAWTPGFMAAAPAAPQGL